jgi:hypothetical protein
MSQRQPDPWKRHAWGPVSSETNGRRARHQAPFSMNEPGSPGLVDLCPICVFLLESDEGQILFEQTMIADIHLVSERQGPVIASTGWHCQLCGASGEGEIPQFHEKPREASQ